ncbi:MAG: glutamine--tRNA ligase, partial [Clostridia bacterium]|nr:glutamine--tRNA ligase [Clostridia bacterium]
MAETERTAQNFIEEFVEEDLANGRFDHVRTRFPPEPNGYLHIGHVKALCIDFGIAQKYGGKCNLRFDDTNPAKEDTVFVEGIQRDIEWLGFKWDKLHFASDFFPRLYEIARDLIRKGLAYVDDQSPEEMRKNRGTLTAPGVDSPFRNRSVEENLDLFERMKNGEFPDGSRVLRAKIDMASPNVLLRDPT